MSTSSPVEALREKYFYVDADPNITKQTRAILTEYSKIPSDQVIRHIRDVRDKAWQTFKYPCIGVYNFLDFSIGATPQYKEILQRVKSGATLLDLGCCFGQDIRKLIYDGAPASNLTGAELEPGFLELGYDLFHDRETLPASTFVAGDFFSPIKLQSGSFDLIHPASFFHLFSWDEQVEVISKALRLLKPLAGSMIFGRQTGVKVPGPMKNEQARSGELYKHDVQTFTKLLGVVSEKTGVKLDVRVEASEKGGMRNDDIQDAHWLNFTITRV